MILEGFVGSIVFAFGLFFMMLVVPRERIKDLLLVGIVVGVLMAFALLYLMQNVWGFWILRGVDLFNILGIPFFLTVAWLPIIIAFGHLLAQYRSVAMIGVILLGFPLGATLIHVILLANNMLVYTNWNLAYTFLVSLGLHLAVLVYLQVTGQLENLNHLKV